MNIIELTKDNIHAEHICCAMADKKSREGVIAKKEWLISRMNDGLKFKKADIKGKVFIEYLPAENAWFPVEAPGYMMINCHWVAGSYKGNGYGAQLLEACEKDAAGMSGVVVITGSKKKPYLADKSFYLKHGYEVCDNMPPYFELMVKRFKTDAPLPSFKPIAKGEIPGDIYGIDIFYTVQCPFTHTYINLLNPVIMSTDVPVRIHHIKTREEAQSHFVPVTTYSVFVNGKFKTHEILTPAKLEKLVTEFE